MLKQDTQKLEATSKAIATIVWGGLAAGTLDAVDGVVAYGFKGLNPIQVLQYIASGLLGPASFQGGLKIAGWARCCITSSRLSQPASTT